MKSTNDQARVPAENYRARARVVLEHIIMQMKGLAGPDHWKEPTEAQMEGFIDEFHAVMNWALDGAKRLGYAIQHFPSPLTEAEMQLVENRLLADVVMARFDGGGAILAKRRKT